MSNGNRVEFDVAIIGGGGAGIPAAIEVARAAGRAVVLEQAAECGGTAAISGGGCCIAGTPLQEAQGIKDTPDLAFEDWVRWGGGAADEVWARFYLEHTLHDLYHWAESCGTKWVDMKFQEGNRVMRWHRPENNGLGLMTALIKTAESLPNITIMTSANAEKLLTHNGRVVGLTATTAKNETIEIRTKAVIVATGGFNSNLDMVLENRPEFKNFKVMECSGFGATGTGHKMIKELGAYFTHMDHIWFYVYATPDYRDPRQRRGLVFRLTPGYIWFNQQGYRFHNEALTGGASATPALLAQNPPHAWAILDTPMTAKMEVADPYYRDGDKVRKDKVQELLDHSPYICKANSLEELGKKIEVDAASFLSTINRYNSAFDAGLERDPEFDKPLKQSKKFDTPPYYAIQIFPLARKNFGGVKTDLNCRVLNKYFEPIPGLYAAGEVAGMAGGHINGRAGLEGTMLGPSIFSGRVAGAWAANEAGFGPGFIGKPNRPS